MTDALVQAYGAIMDLEEQRQSFWHVGNPMFRSGPRFDIEVLERRLDEWWAEVRRLKAERRRQLT